MFSDFPNKFDIYYRIYFGTCESLGTSCAHHHGERDIFDMIFFKFQTLLNWQWWINGVFTSVVLIFGFTGNFVSIFVLLQPKMKNSFNQLLIALCICDTLFIFCNILKVGSAFGYKVPSKSDFLLILLHIYTHTCLDFSKGNKGSG